MTKTRRPLREYQYLWLIIFEVVFFFSTSIAYAREYGNYDPKRILTATQTPSGMKYGVDENYLDKMLNDLAFHARNYPPQFDTVQDRQRAAQDVKTLSGMLDIIVNVPTPNVGMLLRAGSLNSIGYNLDIPRSGDKASSIFQRLLAAAPDHPGGNYLYGTFLAGAGKSKEAIPFIEKSVSAGVVDASYILGMIYLTLGDKKKALKNLESYRQRRPDDLNAVKLIETIRN